jgi:hypothetical protein
MSGLNISKFVSSKNIRKISWIIQFRQNYPRYLFTFVLSVGMLTLGISLLAYAYLGIFSRYYADDYCMTGLFLANGFPKALVILYQTWSNRYAGMILVSLSELFGRSAIRSWTILTLVIWVPVLAWTFLQVSRFMRHSFSRWFSLILAAILVYFTILESPQQFQTIFWRIGLITYTLPLVFLALLTGLILNGMKEAMDGRRAWPGLVFGLVSCFTITLFAGGFSETYVTLQTSILGLALFVTFLVARGTIKRAWLLWLGISFAGSLIALLIVLSAPGNTVRQAAISPQPLNIFILIRMSAGNAFTFMYMTLRDQSFQTVMLFFLSILLAYGFISSNANPLGIRPSRIVLSLLLVPIIGYLLILAVCAPSAYAESSYPEQRVLIEAQFIMVLIIMVEGLLFGISLGYLHILSNEIPPIYLSLFLVLITSMLLLYPLYDARKVITQIPVYRARAFAWDMRDASIRLDKTTGLEDIIVQELESVSGIMELRSDTSFWVNGCAAQFYGVSTIKTAQP